MNLAAFYYRIVKSKKMLAALAAAVLLAAGFGFYAQSHRQELRKNQTLRSLYRAVKKAGDIAYLPYYFRKDGIATYDLVIDQAGIRKLDESLPETGVGHAVLTDRVYVPAQFRYQGQTYDAEVRYRGDEPPHWVDPKKSYLVRFKKGESFMGMNRISFILVDDRKFALEQFNNWRAKKLGLTRVPESGFANLRINGKNHGLYFVIENWSEGMLEKWGAPGGSRLFGDTELPALPGGEAPGRLWQDLDAWKLAAGGGGDDDFAPLAGLLRLVNESADEEFYSRIFEVIDKDNFNAWQVHQELMNSAHQNDGNLRLLYDQQKRKFFFIPWDVSSDPPESDNFGIYGALPARILKNPQFLAEKNDLLRAYVTNAENLREDLAYYDAAYEAMRVSLYRDRLKIFSNRYADRMYEVYRQEIIDNFDRLKRHLQ